MKHFRTLAQSKRPPKTNEIKTIKKSKTHSSKRQGADPQKGFIELFLLGGQL